MKKNILSLALFFSLLSQVFSQDYWLKSNGPASEPISSLIVNSNGYIFAGTYGKGVFLSTDNGNSWLQTSLSDKWVNCMVISPNGSIFVGTDNAGIYRSTDNGTTWTTVNKNIAWTWICSFAFNSSGHIYVGTIMGGLYYSTDNGDNWNPININLQSATITSIIFNSNGDIFIGTDGHSIYRSKDNGVTWTKIGWTGAKIYSFIISRSNKIFAGTAEGIYYSTDNGDTWNRVFDLNLMATVTRSFAINSSGNLFAAADGGDFWTSLSGVYISTDDGNKWTQLKSGLTDIPVYSLAVDSKGYIYAGAKNGYVYRSVNPTALVKEKYITNSYSLKQNYPNPFNPNTTIEYTIGKRAYVKLSVYDFLGKLIANLVNKIQDAGTYKVSFNAYNLSSGVYYYRIETENYNESKQMILLK
ncbi:MAG: T9SS type A sorting domain-containing protein [Melioribacter sp.]|uniref:VPS10 domain-containing protein n=1 Tax=Rosettibacter primus TaxID=3111523 RepID=UPI00247D7F77|nr:T9SS type A sorting domain-containing protein [Melioribacter sp.]